MRKLKFFLIGLVPGLIIVFFILNQKGVSCSGYLPNSRVIAETLSKNFIYADDFQKDMTAENIDKNFVRDSIVTAGHIDFSRSEAQKKPCPDYILVYPKKNPRYEVHFTKCKDAATFNSLKKLR
ncbi:hypothetical protein [Chryseobacterium sp. MFBS3-17]|uniref:hypothetical protein n=1 Tax=Chryseobacterium sp. MFBS3-17 TaxID=2886689 RepID=UPI001D0E95D2|nr:hypothetical protein [Chryseobacterium sp. MFBS3-17]MCC2591432.1 hypothetical protein [Chryseobacterium sp. MFBS3-17]